MKILFFSPHANINQHAIPEILFAEKLKKNGHEIFYISCQKNFKNICACMYAEGITDNSSRALKNEICKSCCAKSKEIINQFNYNEIKISDYISSKEKKFIKEFLQKNSKKKLDAIWYKNIPIGKFAAYEFFLTYKINTIKINLQYKKKYLKHLENTLISFLATKKIIQQIQPHGAVVFNALYSINRAFYENCKNSNVPCISIHNGIHKKYRSRTLFFTFNPKLNFTRNTSEEWKSFKKKKLLNQEKQLVLDEISELRSGRDFWVYSLAKSAEGEDLKLKKNIPDNKKIVTVLLSSFDEFYAATCTGFLSQRKNLLFQNQKKWINFLLNIAKQEKDLYFIFRVHPREYPNKRESQMSSHKAYYGKLKKLKLKNVWINTPDENISIYDLIPITDLALTRTSTAGMEFLYEGKPVYGVDGILLTGYPAEFNKNFKSRKKYKAAIHQIKENYVNKKALIEKWLYFSTIFLADWHQDVWSLCKRSYFQKILYKLWNKLNYSELRILIHAYKTFLKRIREKNKPNQYLNKVAFYFEKQLN